MTPHPQTQTQPATSARVLIATLARHARALAHAEWHLARRELRQSAASATRGAVFIGIAVLFTLVAFHALAVAAVLGLMALGLPGWLAALATTGIVVALAVISALVGKAHLSAKRLTPERTIAQIKTDYAAMKETFRV